MTVIHNHKKAFIVALAVIVLWFAILTFLAFGHGEGSPANAPGITTRK